MSGAVAAGSGVRDRRTAAARTASRVRVLALAATGVATLLAGGFYLGGGWYMSTLLGEQALDAAALRASFARHSYTIPVLAASPAGSPAPTITLSTAGGPAELVTEGMWGLRGEGGGFGQAGPIIGRGSAEVTREYRQLSGPPIAAGERVELVNDSFPADPAVLGLDYQDVTYPGPLGDYPAWFIPGTGADWAILVHGKALARQDEMELLASVHRAGLPMLVITYRNSTGAPTDSSGVFRYGLTEWSDLEAAVRFALGRGARHVVLAGRSGGGAVVASFLERSPLAASVSAVILDAPMLDFSATVDYAASQTRIAGLPIPDSLREVGKWIASRRYGFEWSSLDYLARDSALRAPILVFQGGADLTVPQATSDRLARDRPDLVTYVVTPGAGHLDSWNLDPSRYEGYVERFLTAHAA